jgi:hypothetical protein
MSQLFDLFDSNCEPKKAKSKTYRCYGNVMKYRNTLERVIWITLNNAVLFLQIVAHDPQTP